MRGAATKTRSCAPNSMTLSSRETTPWSRRPGRAPAFEARQAHGALLYEHTDIPEGMTVAQWRRTQAATVVMSDHRRFLRRRPRAMLRATVA